VTDRKDGKKRKGKAQANQAVSDDESSSDLAELSALAHPIINTSPDDVSYTAFAGNRWLADSGTSLHICRDRTAFSELDESPTSKSTIGGVQATASGLAVLGRGSVVLRFYSPGGDKRSLTLRNVAYAPGARDNLISTGRLDRAGFRCEMEDGQLRVVKRAKKDTCVAVADLLENNLYSFRCEVLRSERAQKHTEHSFAATDNSPAPSDIRIWHQRLSHLSEQAIHRLVDKDMATGIQLDKKSKVGACDGCLMGKHARAPFPKGPEPDEAVRKPGVILHADLQGPFDTPSISGARYTLVILDGAVKYAFKYYPKTKDEVPRYIKLCIAHVENHTSRKLKIFRSDNGGEFINLHMQGYFEEKGIRHETSAPRTPQQNGHQDFVQVLTH
jgi:hypothetical protein